MENVGMFKWIILVMFKCTNIHNLWPENKTPSLSKWQFIAISGHSGCDPQTCLETASSTSRNSRHSKSLVERDQGDGLVLQYGQDSSVKKFFQLG